MPLLHHREAERARRAPGGRQGASRYMVEPNIKEGKGGLRDLHTLSSCSGAPDVVMASRWASARVCRSGCVYERRGGNAVRRAVEFLWTVRCHLHFVTDRAEERLTFDLQPELAKRMGYGSRGGRQCGRALHEALFPGSEGNRRANADAVRAPGSRSRQGDAQGVGAHSSLPFEPQAHEARSVTPAFLYRRRAAQRRGCLCVLAKAGERGSPVCHHSQPSAISTFILPPLAKPPLPRAVVLRAGMWRCDGRKYAPRNFSI